MTPVSGWTASVSKAVPLLPSSLTQKYIRLKRIKLNGKGTKRDVKLTAGDTVQMYVNDEFFEPPTEDNAFLKISAPELDVVYEDENILLVNKRAGVLCHSDGRVVLQHADRQYTGVPVR